MYCPKHPMVKMRKARLDVYWCDVCECAWLIKFLSSYWSFEEAARRDRWDNL